MFAARMAFSWREALRDTKKFAAKGVRTGDYLIEADGIPIDDVCTYITIRQQKKPGEEIHFLFRSPDGTEKRVVIARTE